MGLKCRKTYRYLQLFLNIYLIACHNIIRLPTVRKARFELRHAGKVHANTHYKELKIKGIEVCVDRCVADTQCKSVNFLENKNETLDLCQLVAYDVTENNNYADRQGWKHYDTGRTKVTRFRQKSTGKCYVPAAGGCNFQKSGIQLVSSEDQRCNKLEAYFEFDRDTGTIYHYCSGKLVCPFKYQAGDWVMIMSECTSVYKKMNDMFKRWRITLGQTLAFHSLCWSTKTEATGQLGLIASVSNTCYLENNVMDLVDLESAGPVKVSLMNGINRHGFDGSLNYLLHHPKYLNPDKILYLSSFEWTKDTPYQKFALRMQTIFQAPFTGSFRFWFHLYGTAVFLYIGDDETEQSKKLIASGTSRMEYWTWKMEYSGVKVMEKGKKYYMEVLYQNGALQNLFLAMSGDAFGERVIVSHDYLEPYLG